MSYLLDTNVFLWAEGEPERLNPQAQALLADSHQAIYLSPASTWEIIIKVALGKLKLPESPARFVSGRMAQGRLLPLFITHEHALRVGQLPPYHRDPFDRMLVAQSLCEEMVLLTADPQVTKYPIETLWCGRSPQLAEP